MTRGPQRQGRGLLAALAAVALAAGGLSAGEPPAGDAAPAGRVYLDGSSSRDPGGGTLRYAWRQVAGPPVEIRDGETVRPWFVPDGYGIYEFELRVSNGTAWSDPARVRVTVSPENRAPRADPGPDMSARMGDEVLLDGRRSSDPDGDELTYSWRQHSGPNLGLNANGATQPVLKVKPKGVGRYVLELVVSDGELESPPARITLTVTERSMPPPVADAGTDAVVRLGVRNPGEALRANRPPVARAGGSGIVRLGATVVLDGSASSDPDGDRIRHFWVQKKGPTVRVLRPTDGGAKVSFKPPAAGEYEFALTVSDGLLDGRPVALRIRVHEGAAPVVADAGKDITCVVGDNVRLDGSGSGPSGKLTFLWRQTSGPRVTKFHLEDFESTDTPEFVPKAPGVYVFELVVADSTDRSLPDTVKVTVSPRNRAPELDAPEIVRARPGERVKLPATASDPEGAEIEWSWRQVSGPARILRRADRSEESPEVVPRREGKYLFEVSVSDGESVPARELVALVVADPEPEPETEKPKPVARCAGTTRTRIGKVIALDAMGSEDPGGEKLSYQWRQVAGGPLGIPETRLVGERVGLRFWRKGTWVFELVVTAGGRKSDPVRAAVIVEE